MKIDLLDTTFLIPFKKDSDQRLRNINFVIKYISKYFNTNILIMEQDVDKNFVLEPVEDNCKIVYTFVKAENYLFHRTKLLNMMAKQSTTPIISLYDTDVIFKPEQYVWAVEAIRKNVLDMVFPYNGMFNNYCGEALEKILATVSLDDIKESDGGVYNPNSVGGAIFFNKQKFIECGMENENFMSWGFEDNCRIVRNARLGNRVGRTDGILYHLNHPTSENSSNIKHKAYIDNNREYMKVNNMSIDQLRQYVNSWGWCK